VMRLIIAKYIFRSICLFISSFILSHLVVGQSCVIVDSSIISAIEVVPETIINTPNSEYAPVYFGDNIGYVYSSKARAVDKTIGEPFYDLGYAAKDTTGMLALSASFSKVINSLSHEGPFTVSGNNIYFTRIDEVRKSGKKDYTRKIYCGEINGDKAIPLDFSTDEVSVCHPTLSSDGNTMIFSGDMEGIGDMDLYQSKYIGGKWTETTKLIGDVNTENHEFFPFLFQDSILIFSSDRGGGYGGYDHYISAFRNGEWTTPQLVSEPLNSQYDDLGLIIRADGKRGYFASNRPGGEGKDDIYNFRSLKSIFFVPEVSKESVTFTILDKLRFVPIKGATVKITELVLTQDKLNVDDYNIDLLPGTDEGELLLKLSPKKGKELPIAYADENGVYNVNLSPKSNYIISSMAPGYESSTFVFSSTTYGNKLDIVLEPKATSSTIKPTTKPIFIPTTKGSIVIFNNVYYDYNSATIQEGAATELDALVNAMLLNQNMEILLGSHTDSRGDEKYNIMLSEERALAAKKYLTERGVRPSRISTRGYGETQVRNKCKNGVPCTEEEHKYNRRTEVKILKI